MATADSRFLASLGMTISGWMDNFGLKGWNRVIPGVGKAFTGAEAWIYLGLNAALKRRSSTALRGPSGG
jgi:hypothetical protein